MAIKRKRKPAAAKTPKVKKLSRDYCGQCELQQLPAGTYFRVVSKDGKMSKETYTKGYYVPSDKKYECAKHSDIWGNGRALKGTTKVTTDFFY